MKKQQEKHIQHQNPSYQRRKQASQVEIVFPNRHLIFFYSIIDFHFHIIFQIINIINFLIIHFDQVLNFEIMYFFNYSYYYHFDFILLFDFLMLSFLFILYVVFLYFQMNIQVLNQKTDDYIIVLYMDILSFLVRSFNLTIKSIFDLLFFI